MNIQLSCDNFFKYYIFNPNSDTLSKADQTRAKVALVALTVLTLGIGLAVAYFTTYDAQFIAKFHTSRPAQNKVESANTLNSELKGADEFQNILNADLNFNPKDFKLSLLDNVREANQRIHLLFFYYENRFQIFDFYKGHTLGEAETSLMKLKEKSKIEQLPLLPSKDLIDSESGQLSQLDLKQIAYRLTSITRLYDSYEVALQQRDISHVRSLLSQIADAVCMTDLLEKIQTFPEKYHQDSEVANAVEQLLFDNGKEWKGEISNLLFIFLMKAAEEENVAVTKEEAEARIVEQIGDTTFSNGKPDRMQIKDLIEADWEGHWEDTLGYLEEHLHKT